MSRFARPDQRFFCERLLSFEIRDLLFVGADHAAVAGFYNPVEKLINLPVEVLQFGVDLLGDFSRLRDPSAPGVTEHRAGKRMKAFRRL
jgi:hypothetical protein